MGCVAPLVTALSDLGGETPAGFRGDAVGEGPSSTTQPSSCIFLCNDLTLTGMFDVLM